MSKCMLIVDDEQAIVEGLQIRAELAGWHVVSAYDGTRGLQLANTHRPDLIVLDVRMPGLDGMQTLHELRRGAATAEIPVVMISGNPDDRQAALTAGASGFLSKPHRTSEFLQIVAENSPDGCDTPHGVH